MLVLLAICLTAVVAEAAPGELYTDKYDNVDLDEILRNARLYNRYLDCLLKRGRCTPDGEDLRAVIPDALATKCSKCTVRQKDGTEKVIRYLIEKKPEDFKAIEAMYDPGRIYRAMYSEDASSKGIVLPD